jgi:hypothetical protein
LYNTGQGRRQPGTPALEPRLDPEEDIVEGFAAPDDFTEATLALEFLAQDDGLFFQLKLQPIGIGGHITDNSTISAIAGIVPLQSVDHPDISRDQNIIKTF